MMKKSAPLPAHGDIRDPSLRALIHKSGRKATPPRIAILALFQKNKNPMSAREIIAALPRSARVNQATVYRALMSFKTCGIIRQIDLRHNHAHYELAGANEHHHLICLRCGRIEDVPHREADAAQDAIVRGSKHFAEIRQHTLEFYGVCKTCARNGETAAAQIHKNAPR